MNTLIRICSGFFFVFITACSTPGGVTVSSITPEVKNAIAVCNAGLESETRLKIEGAIEQNGGRIDGGLSDSLKGIFASRPNLTSSDAIESQKIYMECLDKRASQQKNSSLQTCKQKLNCDLNAMQEVCACRTTITQISAEEHYPNSFRDKEIKGCYSAMAENLKNCWSGDNINAERSFCETLLQEEDTELPSPSKNSCLGKEKS